MTILTAISPFECVPILCAGVQPSKNRLIEGDNLEVLAALPDSTVDLVCTDPPYGTGKQFRYNDNWKRYIPHPAEGVYVTEHEVGRHAGWINFMASRLRHMKRLLKPSGVITISIGKEKLFHLGILMDDLFGEQNRLGIINWEKRFSPSNDSKHIADTTDYVLIYAKDRRATRETASRNSITGSLWGMADPCFDPDRLKIGDVPLLSFPSAWYEEPFHLGCQSWRGKQSGYNHDATKLLNAIMGIDDDHRPMTPKPLKLIEKIIQLWCPPDGCVLDPFAGSGTTGHAVLDLNTHLHANRTFILVEQGNPVTGDPFAQTGTSERLRRVLTGEWASGRHAPLSGSFTFEHLKMTWREGAGA
jgi:DNA modification methylase